MTDVKQKYTLEEILEIIGDPDEPARKMEKDREDSAAFWQIEPELLKKYPKKWIVFYDGELRAVGSSQRSVLEKSDALGLPRGDILVEYLDPDPETLILERCLEENSLPSRDGRFSEGGSSCRVFESREESTG